MAPSHNSQAGLNYYSQQTSSAEAVSPDPSTVQLQIAYYTVRYDKHTLSNTKVNRWMNTQLAPDDRVLYACSGETPLPHTGPVTAVDLDPSTDPDIVADITDLEQYCDPHSFSVIVFDPPFSQSEADRTYNGQTPGYGSEITETFDTLLEPSGKVIQFGYRTACMPPDRGYMHTDLAIFNTFGRMKDFFGIVDRHFPGESLTREINHHPEPVTVPLNKTGTTRTDSGISREVDVSYTVLPADDDGLPALDTDRLTQRICADQGETAYDTHNRLQTGTHAPHRLPHTIEALATTGESLNPETSADCLYNPDAPGYAPPVTARPDTIASDVHEPADTVFYAPPEADFRCNAPDETPADTTGADSATRESIATLLKPGGECRQLGRSRVGAMPSNSGFTRTSLHLFETPADTDVLCLAVDTKPVDSEPDTTQDRPGYASCLECGQSLPTADWEITDHCPVCLATQGEHCTRKPDTPSDSVVQGTGPYSYHSERIDQIVESHPATDSCPGRQTGPHLLPPAITMMPLAGVDIRDRFV